VLAASTALMMGAARTSETNANVLQDTRRNNAESSRLQITELTNVLHLQAFNRGFLNVEFETKSNVL
jgi:hypothetical protein